MLIDYKSLMDDLDDYMIIDTRGKVAYLYSHIPNSIPLHAEDLMVFDNYKAYVMPIDKASKLLSDLGITRDRRIVLYGEYLDPSMARVFWSLLYYGYKDVSMLNVGFGLWKRLGLPITRKVYKFDKVDLELDANDSIKADADYIIANKPLLIDSRSMQEYMQGRISNAINIPWETSLGLDGMMFASNDELRSNFKQYGIKDSSIVCYCTHGVRASYTFASLLLAGFNDVKVYDGSIMDWISRRLPLSY